jgi:hypothetical protein
MENLRFGQENKMPINTPNVIKESMGTEEVLESRVKIIQRDIALNWPSSDPLAENPAVFEDYLTVLLNAGWNVQNTQIGVRRAIGDMANEFVIPILFILTR